MGIKEKDIVVLYKKILDPMGYVVVPKVEKQEPINKWVPKDHEKYKEMKTLELQQKINEAKTELSKLDDYIVSVKEKAISFMNGIEATAYTEDLYKGTYAANSVIKSGVIVSCETHTYTKKLIEYLETLLLNRLKKDLVDKFREVQDGLLNMEVSRDMAQAKLKIEVK